MRIIVNYELLILNYKAKKVYPSTH